MTYNKKEILQFLENNRNDLVKQFPDIAKLTSEELFEHFFAIESTFSTGDGIVYFDEKKISLSSKFDKHDIESLNKFKRIID